MTRGKETFFGDINTFAVRYVSEHKDKDNGYYYAYCHLVLGGQIIGNKDESCYLNSFKHSFESLKDQVKNEFESIKNIEFQGRTDDELFELIWKANQIEDEFNPKFEYLPVLNRKVWSNCKISIDETIDAYLITMTEINGAVKFIWKGWRNPCPVDKIDKLFTIVADRDLVVKTMEKCLDKIKDDYPNIP